MADSQTLTDRALLQVPAPLKMKLQANLLAHYKSTGIDVKFGRHAEEIRRFMDRILNDGHTIGPSSGLGPLGAPR